jgi:hypothetical protein
MPIEAPAGTLEVENAKFRASSLEATEAVGIGTESNRDYPLQVFKETAPDIRISEGSTLSSAARLYSNNSNLYIQTGADFTAGSSGDVAFQTMEGQSTHMVIKSDGKVGVGTTSPGTALEVYSSTGTQLTLSSSSRYTTIYGVDDTGSCFFGNDGGDFRITTGGDTSGTGASEALRVNSSGNVGIGTNSPAYTLDVRGTASHAGSELMARWNSQNETVFPQSATAQYHKIATLGTTGDGANGGKLRISGTIGGFSQSETTLIDAFVSSRNGISYGGTLHGYGGGDPPTDQVDILVYREANNTFAVWIKLVQYFTFDFTVTGGTITGASRTSVLLPCPVTNTSVATPTGTLEGSVVSACSIVFTADGNVGIGTTNPGYKLDVASGYARINTIGFAAYSSGATTDTSATSVFIAGSEYFDNGDCYSTTTGKFSAPVDGIYVFGWSSYTNYAGSTQSRIFAMKNDEIYTQVGDNIDTMGNQLTVVVKLDALDTFHFKGSTSYPMYYYNSKAHNITWGYLLTAI